MKTLRDIKSLLLENKDKYPEVFNSLDPNFIDEVANIWRRVYNTYPNILKEFQIDPDFNKYTFRIIPPKSLTMGAVDALIDIIVTEFETTFECNFDMHARGENESILLSLAPIN